MAESVSSHDATAQGAEWKYELVDLTRPLTKETSHALLGDLISGDLFADGPDLTMVNVEYILDWNTSNGSTAYLSMSDHIGTHIDAPYHCWKDGATLEGVEVRRLFGEAVVLDLFRGPADYGYTGDDFESAGQDVRAGDIVLIYSGYVDANPGERVRQTYLTPQGAEWLVERGVHAIGCEPAGLEHVWNGYFVDRWYEKNTPNPPAWPAHQILLSNDVYIIEGLTNLEQIKGRRVRFAALPLVIPGATGCPVRAVAWQER
jgi:arylformamidase